MPQISTITVKAHQIRKGDRVLSVDGKAHSVSHLIVDEIQDKIKLVHIKTPQFGRTFTIPRDDVVQVEREAPTDEELAAQRHEVQLLMIQKYIDEAAPLLAKAKQGLIADLDYLPRYSSSSYATYITARINYDLWRQVQNTVQRLASESGVDMRSIDLVGVTRDLYQQVRNDLIDLSFASRSTSVLHNAVEDCEREARVKWVRQFDRLFAE